MKPREKSCEESLKRRASVAEAEGPEGLTVPEVRAGVWAPAVLSSPGHRTPRHIQAKETHKDSGRRGCRVHAKPGVKAEELLPAAAGP